MHITQELSIVVQMTRVSVSKCITTAEKKHTPVRKKTVLIGFVTHKVLIIWF